MRYIFLIVFAFCATSSWSQHSGFGKKKKPQPVYKTIHDPSFSVGDKIDMGEISIVPLEYHRDTIIIPDSLEHYRAFVQRNQHITFRLNLVWKNQGVKYPWRTDHAREKMLEFINEDGPDENGSYEDSTCYIYGFKHLFVKQGPVFRVELEVMKVEAQNVLPSNGQGAIGLPEMNILYRNYNNIVEFALNGTYDSVWLVGNGVEVSPWNDRFIARVVGTGREASLSVYSKKGNTTTSHGVYKYRVSNLPRPCVYYGSVLMESIKYIPEKDFLGINKIYCKYPPEIPLKAVFDVSKVVVLVGEQRIEFSGAKLSDECKKAIENAEKGTEIKFESIQVIGPERFEIHGDFTRIKQSEKGTPIVHRGVVYSEGCD